MEKATETSIPEICTPFAVTPSQLRIIADKLDLAAKSTLPGQCIDYKFTKELKLRYSPEIPLFSAAADSHRTTL